MKSMMKKRSTIIIRVTESVMYVLNLITRSKAVQNKVEHYAN